MSRELSKYTRWLMKERFITDVMLPEQIVARYNSQAPIEGRDVGDDEPQKKEEHIDAINKLLNQNKEDESSNYP